MTTFRSKSVEKSSGGLRVRGDLTLRGVTKEVVLEVEGPSKEITDPWGHVKLGAAATAKINRTDFGLSYNKALEGGGVVIGEEVTITLDIELNRASD